MDVFNLPKNQQADIRTYIGGSLTAGSMWQTWQKPVGKTLLHIFVAGQGGGGGLGVIGAASTAAGGGGGGSGGQTRVIIPMEFVPDRLYISCGEAAAGNSGIASYVAIATLTTAPHVIAVANGGGVGGNAAGAVGGTAGAAGAIAAVGAMTYGWQYALAFAGQVGSAGGTTIAGTALAFPVTGNNLFGGTGGGGLPAAATAGTQGGSYTLPAGATPYPPHTGGIGGATATTPPEFGSAGVAQPIPKGRFSYGGVGGGSTHGTALTTGLVQAKGGEGAPGCGGGGMGGALTTSTAAAASKGGPGFVIMIST